FGLAAGQARSESHLLPQIMRVRSDTECFHIHREHERILDRVLFRACGNIDPFEDTEQWRQVNARELLLRLLISKVDAEARKLLLSFTRWVKLRRENQSGPSRKIPGHTFGQ